MIARAAGPLQTLVMARVGGLHLAVPAPWVAGAQASAEPLVQLPRRQGAVAGLLPTDTGCIPVVDLTRWVALPAGTADSATALTDATPCYLLLQQDGRRLALQVDELLGLRRVPQERLQRVHQRDDPDELFDTVLPGDTVDAPPTCVLEPQRLMRLLALWCEATGTGADAPAGVTRTGTPSAGCLALVRVAGQRLAVDMRQVAELIAMPSLKTRLAPGRATAGFASWRGATLAVLNAGWLCGQIPVAPGPLALVLRDASGRAVALPVDELLGMTRPPAQTVPLDAAARPWQGESWTDEDGPVAALRVPALLDALPESSLACRPASAARQPTASNEQPYFLLQAGRTAALPIHDVLAVVEGARVSDEQQTLAWRGRQLPLRGRPSPAGVVVVLQGTRGAVALRVERLLGLVPAGAAELSALPGVPGARMLHLPAQASSYAIARADELLPA